MADDQHLAQWQNKMRQSGGASASNANAAKEAEERKKKEAAMEEQRRLMLKQLLSDPAAERVANIRLVKPDKARQVEMLVINAARAGRLRDKVSDDQIKDLLSQVSQQTERRTKVTISRRRTNFDDDDDDDDDDDW